MALVMWRYRIVDYATGPGGRRKNRKRIDLQTVDPAFGGMDVVADGTGYSKGAPNPIQYQGRSYRCAFWSLVGDSILPFVSGPPSFSGFPVYGNVVATAWYVWDQGGGEGAHGIFIDAFDISAGDFFDDDFVDVTPDPDGTLTIAANEGALSTSGFTETEVITARSPVGHRGLERWIEVPLPVSHGATISADEREIHAHNGDIMVAFAMYRPLPRALPEIPHTLHGNVILGQAGGPFVVVVQPGVVPGVPPVPPPGDPVWHEATAILAAYAAAGGIRDGRTRREMQRNALRTLIERLEQTIREV